MVSPQPTTPSVRSSTVEAGRGKRPIDRVATTLRSGVVLALATLVHVAALVVAAVAATALLEPLPSSGGYLAGVTLLFVGLTIVAAAPVVARWSVLTVKHVFDAHSSSPVN